MKVSDRRPVRGAGGPRGPSASAPVSGVRAGAPVAAAAPVAPAGPRAVADSAKVMGIPEVEFTPKVRDAIMSLMREVDQLRNELTRAKARLAELERLADRDTLTPLYNRRAFVRELSRASANVERYGTPISLVYFDLNGLKRINDSAGHAAGDAAIRQIADILAQGLREGDVLARLGGDEFGVILNQSDSAMAEEKAEQLAGMIRSRPLNWKGRTLPLGIAYGVYPLRAGEDPVTALAAADRAMYSHKLTFRERRI